MTHRAKRIAVGHFVMLVIFHVASTMLMNDACDPWCAEAVGNVSEGCLPSGACLLSIGVSMIVFWVVGFPILPLVIFLGDGSAAVATPSDAPVFIETIFTWTPWMALIAASSVLWGIVLDWLLPET